MSRQTGISEVSISAWMQNKGKPTDENLEVVLAFLGERGTHTTVSYIRYGEGAAPAPPASLADDEIDDLIDDTNRLHARLLARRAAQAPPEELKRLKDRLFVAVLSGIEATGDVDRGLATHWARAIVELMAAEGDVEGGQL